MHKIVLRRLLVSIPVLLVVITATFFLIRIAPGGPFDSEKVVSPEILKNLNDAYHLNDPVYLQYLDYLKMNPYVPPKRWSLTSRKENPLTTEQREKRYQVLRKKASLEQRRRSLKSEYPHRALLEAKINVQIGELMVEIVGIGGIPKKWLE